jgi:hypothetical protein
VRQDAPTPLENLIARVKSELSNADQHRDRTIQRLTGRMTIFERIYGLSTADMIQQVDSGQLQETDEILMWRMDAHLLERVTSS